MAKKSLWLDLKVLGYQEDGKWVAHCLEMDLLGHADTFDAALADLRELVEMQVSFAMQKGQHSLLYHPAPVRFFDIYNRLAEMYWLSYTKSQAETDDQYRITSFEPPVPPKHPDKFELVDA